MPIDTPTVHQTDAQLCAAVPLTVPRHEIQNVMGPAIREVYAAVLQQGLTPAGPWRTHHLRMDPGVFDFEVCVPVPAEVTPVGRVRPYTIPAAKVARTIYRGPYEGLGQAWPELRAWIAAQGLECAPGLWEVYAVGPESGLPADQWQTELNQPLT